MNTLVVYDSHYGNTERIAQAIADMLRASGQAQPSVSIQHIQSRSREKI